jgi:hypothetical protein
MDTVIIFQSRCFLKKTRFDNEINDKCDGGMGLKREKGRKGMVKFL